MAQAQDFIESVQPSVESFIGAVRNKVTFDSLKDVLGHLNEIKTYRDSVNKIGDIVWRMNTVDKNDIPRTKEQVTEHVDPDFAKYYSPEELDAIPGIKEYTQYSKSQKDKNEDIESLESYLSHRPDLYKQLHDNDSYKHLWKQESTQVPVNNDELKANWLLAAGISPDEYKWFLDNKDKYSATKLQSQLHDIEMETVPYFLGRGEEGKQYAGLLSSEIAELGKTQAPKFHLEKLGDDLYRVDDLTGGATKIATGTGKEKPMPEIHSSLVEKDGQYYHHVAYDNGKGQIVFKDVLDPDQTETEKQYLDQQKAHELKQEQVSQEDRLKYQSGMPVRLSGGETVTKPEKKGRSKTAGDKLDLGEKWDYGDMVKVAKDKRNYKNLDDEQQDDYIQLKSQMMSDYKLSEGRYNQITDMLADSDDKHAKQLFKTLESGKQKVTADVNTIINNMKLNDVIHSLYMIDTSGGADNLTKSLASVWRQLGDQYNSLPPEARDYIYQWFADREQEILKSKGLTK